MFDKHFPHGAPSGRRRHDSLRRELHGEMGRHLREELRRSFGHGRGQHRGRPDLRDFFGGGGRPSVRRGDIRILILRALEEHPMHGYEVIQTLEAKSRGMWRPSAGSVYPTLQQLADEGLVIGEDVDGRRTYRLTDEGRKVIAESPSGPTWDDADADDRTDIRKLAMQLAAAVIQVHRVGSPRAQHEVTKILTDARKQVYRLLAEDEDADADAADVQADER